MKKAIIGLLVLLTTFNTIHADICQAGLRFGISTSRINLSSDLKRCYDPELGFGYQLGGMTRITLPIIYIQPELLFTNSKSKYSWQNQKHTLTYKKIELPIMVGIKFIELLRLQLGPIFSFLISAKDNDIDVTSNYKRLAAGYQLSVGIDIKRFLIDLKYEGSLSKFGDKLGGLCAEHRESLLILSIGINLL